jgi:hypothetical protein
MGARARLVCVVIKVEGGVMLLQCLALLLVEMVERSAVMAFHAT